MFRREEMMSVTFSGPTFSGPTFSGPCDGLARTIFRKSKLLALAHVPVSFPALSAEFPNVCGMIRVVFRRSTNPRDFG